MVPADATRLFRRSGLLPPVRATHTQLEIDYLPPYGDPEVNVLGELATYLLLGGLVVGALERLRD